MKKAEQTPNGASPRHWPDAATTTKNVTKGVLDESYLAVSPFDIDESDVRTRLARRRSAQERPAVKAKLDARGRR